VVGVHRRLTDDKLAGTDPGEVSAPLGALMQEDQVGYAKPCLARTESVITDLARYTHRITISNARIEDLDDDQASVRYRDYRGAGAALAQAPDFGYNSAKVAPD